MNRTVEEYRTEIVELCQRFHVVRLDLFGSAATGDGLPDESDLDFLVEFGSMAPASYANAYFGFLESVEQLFHRPVDLVVDSAIENPYFRESVERTRVQVYAA